RRRPSAGPRIGGGVGRGAGEGPGRYFPNAGRERGPLLHGPVPGAIGVIEDLDKPMPIGMAMRVGVDATGAALWELVVDDVLVPGRWVVIDREFRPAQ